MCENILLIVILIPKYLRLYYAIGNQNSDTFYLQNRFFGRDFSQNKEFQNL